MKVKKNKKTQVKEFFKKNWKKVAIVGAGATAVVGAITIFVIKAKNGDCDNSLLDKVINGPLHTLDPVTYIVDDNGVRFEMNALLNADGNVSQMAFNDITADEVHKAIEYLNPDVWGINANQHKWDEVIYIMH